MGQVPLEYWDMLGSLFPLRRFSILQDRAIIQLRFLCSIGSNSIITLVQNGQSSTETTIIHMLLRLPTGGLVPLSDLMQHLINFQISIARMKPTVPKLYGNVIFTVQQYHRLLTTPLILSFHTNYILKSSI